MCGRCALIHHLTESEMDTRADNCWRYQIRIEERLDADTSSWFEDACMTFDGAETILEITVVDQSQLQGMLKRIHDLHLHVVSVERLTPSKA